jgi:hypothetical protein
LFFDLNEAFIYFLNEIWWRFVSLFQNQQSGFHLFRIGDFDNERRFC